MNSLSIIDPAEKATSLSNMSSQVPLLQDVAAMGDIFTEKSKVFDFDTPFSHLLANQKFPAGAKARLNLSMEISA